MWIDEEQQSSAGRKQREKSNFLKTDKDQGKIDFHSLRHTFGTLLAASGVHPKTAQDLMRHSDINLTMSRYTHSLRDRQVTAINSLPNLDSQANQVQEMTGTDNTPTITANAVSEKRNSKNNSDKNGAVICAKLCTNQQISVDNNGQNRHNFRHNGEKEKPALWDRKQGFQGHKAGFLGNTPDRIRTCDLRIRNPQIGS